MPETKSVNRRDFMKSAAGVGATLGIAGKAFGAKASKAASVSSATGWSGRAWM